jgi:hypothetical protein
MTILATRAAAPRTGEAAGRLCMPLRDVIARIDIADVHHASTVRLYAGDGGQLIDLPLHGTVDGDLRRLLAGAADRRFDTVRITSGPGGPVVGVCRRRHRNRT